MILPHFGNQWFGGGKGGGGEVRIKIGMVLYNWMSLQ